MTQPSPFSERCYLFTQGLIYPAFAGALTFNFFQQLWQCLWAGKILATSGHLLWLASGIWFVVYFTCAYTEFLKVDKPKFGLPALLANLVECGIILIASITIADAGPDKGSPPLEYSVIYWCWIGIPITGFLANLFSGREPKYILTWMAFFLSFSALILAGIVGPSLSLYGTILAGMSALLFAYVFTVWILD